MLQETQLFGMALLLSGLCLGLLRLPHKKVFVHLLLQKTFYYSCRFFFCASLILLSMLFYVILFDSEMYKHLCILSNIVSVLVASLAIFAVVVLIFSSLEKIENRKQYLKIQEKIETSGDWSFLGNVPKQDIPTLISLLKKGLSNSSTLNSTEMKTLSHFLDTIMIQNKKQIRFNLLHCFSCSEAISFSILFKRFQKKAIWNLCGFIVLQMVWVILLAIFQNSFIILLMLTLLHLLLSFIMIITFFHLQKELRKIQNEYVQKNILEYFTNM